MSDLVFPSGLTVNRAKKRAKTLVKHGQAPSLAKALDFIAMQQVNLTWAKASVFLKESLSSQFPVKESSLIATADIISILNSNPLLSYNGFGQEQHYSDKYYKRFYANSQEEYIKNFQLDRVKLREASEECQRACLYLDHLTKLRNLGTRFRSYSLKHFAEHYLRELGNSRDDSYISNGAFICAAIHMGFPVERCDSLSSNAYIGVSKNSAALLWKNMQDELASLTEKEKIKLSELKRKIGLPV